MIKYSRKFLLETHNCYSNVVVVVPSHSFLHVFQLFHASAAILAGPRQNAWNDSVDVRDLVLLHVVTSLAEVDFFFSHQAAHDFLLG